MALSESARRAIRRIAAQTARDQGKPAQLEDPGTVQKVAQLFRRSVEENADPKDGRKRKR